MSVIETIILDLENHIYEPATGADEPISEIPLDLEDVA